MNDLRANSGQQKATTLSARQSLCLSGLPVDGSFVSRGGAYHSSYAALEAKGLVQRRRDGIGFAWARIAVSRTESEAAR